jgi:membrane peptidoglycan carboxypeptidase
MNRELLRRPRRGQGWRWFRRVCYVLLGLIIVGPVVAFAVGYLIWQVPSPEALGLHTEQTVPIDYVNGAELTRLVPSSGNRTMITNVQDVSIPMKEATLAAEDPTFYQNWGFDIMGIVRAAWSQITGTNDTGGSTLTQQYIKMVTGNDQHTYSRKFKEIVLAFKMSREQTKDEILKAYLNTAYYGRGAYGVAAAAQTYFNEQPKDLSLDQAAVLAGMVQQPTNNDPRIDPPQAQARFNYVADQLARYRFVSPQQRAAMRSPQTAPLSSDQPPLDATQYFIRQQVLAELNRDGYSEQTLEQHGDKVITTLDPQAQQYAQQAVTSVLRSQPSNLHPGLVAIDPTTGAVRAYYGGAGPSAGGYDYAAAPQQPGSSFKPFVALAGLEQGKGLGEVYNGTSPQVIAGTTFHNDPGVVCNVPTQCGVREAMTKSVNTVFVNMAVQFGTSNVANAAYQAGIPRTTNGKPTLENSDGDIDAGIALGMYPISTTSMASAYATFADEGMRNQPRFVARIVSSSSGQTVRDFAPTPRRAFSADPTHNQALSDNVTEAMFGVAPADNLTLDGGRPVAAKTGTAQYGNGDSPDNSTAWLVGYTPQISTAVSLSAGTAQDPVEPVRDSSGNPVYGASLPGHIWQQFMNDYLAGKPVLSFPQAQPIGQYQLPPPPPPPPAPSPTLEPPQMPTLPPWITDLPSIPMQPPQQGGHHHHW